ncbi:hypothetical protein ACFFRR_001567 [Megaselia abdita]
MGKVNLTFFLILSLVCVTYCYDISLTLKSTEGCSVKDQIHGRDYKIPQDFTNNKPKVNEVFRLKSYYYGNSPMMSFYAKGNKSPRPTFTIYLNYTTFALFNDINDFISSRDPICTQSNVTTFSKNYYTEFDIFLMKDGVFSVVAYGENGFSLSCRLDTIFTASENDYLVINFAHSAIMSVEPTSPNARFYFDCPFRN